MTPELRSYFKAVLTVWRLTNPVASSALAANAARYRHHYAGHHIKKPNPVCKLCIEDSKA
jgi:hypothetical protein